MKKLYTLLAGSLFIAANALAQAPQEHLRIQISYQGAGQHLEQAIETIEAVNVIGKATTVDYQAGRSITLLPGFEAKQGSSFTALIKPVSRPSLAGGSEFPLRLSAFPNPFEQSTTIEYDLPADGNVNLWVTDAQGKIIGKLIQDEQQTAGRHRLEWTPTAVSPGVYIPVIEANQKRAVARIIKK